MRFKSKFFNDSLLSTLVCVVFGITFFSIPLCSFRTGLNIVTWIFTFVTIELMVVRLILNKKFEVDFVSLCCLLFPVSALISVSLNNFVGFVPTSLYLSFLVFLLYSYFLCFKNDLKKAFFSCFLATVAFLLVFIFHYKNEIISFSFSRLGGDFGDINDISIFMGLGFSFSYYYFLTNKRWYIKLLFAVSLLLFVFCGLLSGSKIFILLLVVPFFALTVLFFGKKRWYISFSIVLVFCLFLVLVMTMPLFNTIKTRILEMLSLLFGKSIGGARTDDASTLGRMQMFENGIEMFFRKPLFGWGTWGFASFGGFNYGWSHNNFSESLCNFGIVGTILFHFGIVFSFSSFLRLKRKNEVLLPFTLLIFFITMMFGVALNSQKIYAYLCPIVFASLKRGTSLYSFSKKEASHGEKIENY